MNAVRLPAIYSILPTPFPGEYNVLFGANEHLPEADVRQQIKEDVERLRNLTGDTVTVDEFIKFIDHSPFGLYVDAADIRDGFYQSLLDLQGYRSTYYIGATMDTHSTPDAWHHADDLIESHFPEKSKASGEVEAGTL